MNRKKWIEKTYGAMDALDLDGFMSRLSDSVRFQMGNGETVFGKSHARRGFRELFESLASMHHDIDAIWINGQRVGVEGHVELTARGGDPVRIPCFGAWRLHNGVARRVDIYIDTSPAFANLDTPSICDGSAWDLVDEAGRGSFPASDPPSWTTGREVMSQQTRR